MSLNNPVRTLNPEVARKIAAGEVIDRPNAIIRELMDNSIDSGASNITVEISGGGIDKIRIIDNGCGMTKDDLQNCAHPHATSKISSEIDLMNLSTLGFRGEALASIAAVARLSIQSGSYKMRASITEDHILEPIAEIKGTIVQSEGLFENFPARRQFLKRAATEGVMCKNTFIEKAMARPDISFRFIQDGQIKIDLPGGQSLKDRFIMANSYNESPELFFELNGSSGEEKPDWNFNVVIGEPAVSRTNKKEIVIYVNGRKIQEYSLVQAVEYGGQGFFPNGTYPVAAVFVQIRPDLVDFNIHPAKKEARFSDISVLHHALSSGIKSFFRQYTYSNFREDKAVDEIRLYEESLFSDKSLNDSSVQSSGVYDVDDSDIYKRHIEYKQAQTREHSFADFRSRYLGGNSASGSTVSSGFSSSSSSSSSSGFSPNEQNFHSFNKSNTENLITQAIQAAQNTGNHDFQTESQEESQTDTHNSNTESRSGFQNISPKVRFIGCCLGTFLLAEKNSCLYIVDQHAAHERILFDKIMKNQDGSGKQPLLIPYKIHTESKSQDNQIKKLQPRLNAIGFETNFISDGYWEITSIPERWTGTEYDLKTLIFVKHVEPDEIIRSIAAMTACKAAVKDGYVLDDITAARLVEQAFTLEDPHCPHGRPIYTVLSREKLFELVKRT